MTALAIGASAVLLWVAWRVTRTEEIRRAKRLNDREQP